MTISSGPTASPRWLKVASALGAVALATAGFAADVFGIQSALSGREEFTNPIGQPDMMDEFRRFLEANAGQTVYIDSTIGRVVKMVAQGEEYDKESLNTDAGFVAYVSCDNDILANGPVSSVPVECAPFQVIVVGVQALGKPGIRWDGVEFTIHGNFVVSSPFGGHTGVPLITLTPVPPEGNP